MSNKHSKQTISLIAIIIFCLFNNNIQAQTKTKDDILGRMGSNVITTAVPFLQIAPDTRIGGMGEAGVAVLNDANAQHWNPAKYICSDNQYGFSVSYSPWLAGLHVRDIYLLYASGFGKFTSNDALSGSVRYFSMGNMEITNEEGEVQQNYKPHEFAIDLAYSRQLIENLSMAVTGRFIYSNLTSVNPNRENKPGLSGAADISLFYLHKFKTNRLYSSNIAFGLNISNIGAKISYSSSSERDFLPANFRVGIAYSMNIDKYNRLVFAFDINKLLVPTPPIYATDSNGVVIINQTTGKPVIDKGRDPNISSAEAVFTSWGDAPGGFKEEMSEFVLNVGLEYSYNNILFIRTGYFNESQYKGRRKYFTFGVGLKYSVFAIDAAYILPVGTKQHPLENTLRFSISFEFGQPKKVQVGY